jgi:hypothetical protein
VYYKLEVDTRGISCRACQVRQGLLREDERIRKEVVLTVVVGGSGVREGLKRE